MENLPRRIEMISLKATISRRKLKINDEILYLYSILIGAETAREGPQAAPVVLDVHSMKREAKGY